MPFGHICSFLTFFYSLFLSLGTKLEIIILNLFTLSRVVSKSINSYPSASKCLARDSVTRQTAANQASWILHSTTFPQTKRFWLLLLPTTPLPHNWTITLNYFLKVVCAICHITGLDFWFLLSITWGMPETGYAKHWETWKHFRGEVYFPFCCCGHVHWLRMLTIWKEFSEVFGHISGI